MTDMVAGRIATERLRADNKLTVTMGALGSAIIERLQDGTLLDQTNLGNGQVYTFGEYAIDVVLRISCLADTLSYVVSQPTASRIISVGGSLGPGSVPQVISAYVTATESGNDAMRRTVLKIANLPITLTDALQYAGTKLYTFPEGRIHVLGSMLHIAETTTSILASTLLASKTGAVSLGSAAASNTTLSSTMVDLAPSTAWTSSATINVAGTAVDPILASAFVYDGHTTALSMFLNAAVAGVSDIIADASTLWSGYATITWSNLGDY